MSAEARGGAVTSYEREEGQSVRMGSCFSLSMHNSGSQLVAVLVGGWEELRSHDVKCSASTDREATTTPIKLCIPAFQRTSLANTVQADFPEIIHAGMNFFGKFKAQLGRAADLLRTALHTSRTVRSDLL